MTDFVVWNVNPEIFRIGNFAVRYYGLLFAAGFFFGYLIMARFFKKEGIPLELLDSLTVYTAIGTIVGARLGHCFFYEPEYFLKHPLEILKIWHGGLASHGAAIGILLALYLFARKKKKSYLWVLDRVVIVVALAGMFIRTGNLMNSEIYGFPTGKTSGFVYARHLTEELKSLPPVNQVKFYKTAADAQVDSTGAVPLEMVIRFERTARNENELQALMQYQVKPILHRAYTERERNVYLPPGDDPEFTLSQDRERYFNASIPVMALPRHPTHIYEALTYLLIFLFLLGVYLYLKGRPRHGLIFGLFLIVLFTARFAIEFIKENQVEFEDRLELNMGQWLSIPFILAGAGILLYIYLKKPSSED